MSLTDHRSVKEAPASGAQPVEIMRLWLLSAGPETWSFGATTEASTSSPDGGTARKARSCAIRVPRIARRPAGAPCGLRPAAPTRTVARISNCALFARSCVIRVLPLQSSCGIIIERHDALIDLEMDLNVMERAIFVDKLESVARVTVHVTVAIRSATVRK